MHILNNYAPSTINDVGKGDKTRFL